MKERVKYDFARLDQYCKDNNVVLLEDYSGCDLNSIKIIKSKCLNESCHNICEKLFKSFIISGSYCNSCSKKNKMDKIKNFNILNYGYDFPFSSNIILNKSKETCIKKYDVCNPFKNKEILEKTKQTLIERYGVKNPILNEDIKNRIKYTFIKKYGKENFLQTEEIKDIRKQKCFEQYGVNHYLQSDEVKEKMKLNNIVKYGVEYPNQNENVMEQYSKRAYKFKTYKFKSGKEIKCQGYEPFALNEINENLNDDEIITGAKNVPKIWYYDANNKKHRHYVDIYIKSQNKCIEVKSTWTYQKKKDNVLLKQQAGKELGYKYEIWVYDKKGNKIWYD